jgi:hypothetical protein
LVEAATNCLEIRFANKAPENVESFAILPTGGTRLPIVRSSNVGASPFLGQPLGKQSGSTLLGPYTAFAWTLYRIGFIVDQYVRHRT